LARYGIRATTEKEDLPMAKPINDVIVLLPGILGSALRRDGRDVWAISGGTVGRALLSLGGSITDLALRDESTDPTVNADGVTAERLLDDVHLIPGLWKIDGYTKISEAIKKTFAVEEGANFFPFPYDWRRDNRVAAKQLAAKTKTWLAEWRKRPGKQNARLILLAHSMGGLVSRYFLEVLDGWRDTRMLVTFGTPYFGSLNAVNVLANGLKVGFGPLAVDLSPLIQSLPALHQLLPTYSCYDPGTGDLAHTYDDGIDIPNLDPVKATAAHKFHTEIEDAVTRHLKDNEYMQNRYIIHPIVGRKQPTLQSAVRRGATVEMLSTYKGTDEEGDGTVPRVSATPKELDGEQRETFAAEMHGSLQNSDSVWVNVEGILGGLDIHSHAFRAGVSAAKLAVRLGIRDAYPDKTPVTMTVRPEESFVDLEATVVDVATNREVQTVPAQPAGAAERTVSFAGLQPGTYRVTVHGDDVDAVSDVFLVLPSS
jgi:pimeloyl-ACP methyl ester carboxylesterase